MALPSLRTAQSVQPTGCSNSFRPVLQNSDEKLKTLETFRACYRAGIKANRYIRANRDGTIQFLIDWMKLNRETAAPAYDGVVKVYDADINICEKGLRLVIDETKKPSRAAGKCLSAILRISRFSEKRRENSGQNSGSASRSAVISVVIDRKGKKWIWD